METTPLTTSFPKSKGNNIETDQLVNPKNQGKSWISFGEKLSQGKRSSVNLQKELKCWVYFGRNRAQMKWPTVKFKKWPKILISCYQKP
jgi:hypothetical protein